MDKDEILTQIIEVEKKITENKEQHNKLAEDVKSKEKIEKQHRTVYEELRQQLDLVAEGLRAAFNDLNDAKASLKENNNIRSHYLDELAKLRRALDLQLDAERIQAEYQAQMEAFRNATLSAAWRKENRTDGLGAFEHQIEGAIRLAVAKQGFLGDKRGLGKSLTSIIYADLLDAHRVIVITPSDTMDNFIREIKLWAPHRSIIKLGKMPKAERDFALMPLKLVPQYVLVINYEAWRRDTDLVQDLINLKADTLIYDEAHKSKTWTTHICKGVMSLRFGLNQCPNCKIEVIEPGQILVNEDDVNEARCTLCGQTGFITDFCSIKNVLPMTGTPILNKPQELFPHVRAIDPKNFKDEKNYLRDFCRKGTDGRWRWQYGGEDRLVKLIGPRYVARDRKAAGIIIPPATPIEHRISKDEFKEGYPRQYEAYEQVRKYAQLVMDNEGNTMSMAYMIVVLMRLRQVLTWPAGIELKRKDENGIEYVVSRLNVYESVKLDKAQELATEIIEEGESVLGFSMFVEPLHEMEYRLGPRTLAYTGRTAQHLLDQAQLDFDPKTAPVNPKWDSLWGTYQKMGTGLNLNRATHEIFIDRFWNPGGEEQAEGRIDRIGTTRDTYIHRIMVEDTIDTWMENLIQIKSDLISGFAKQADLYQEMYRALREGDI